MSKRSAAASHAHTHTHTDAGANAGEPEGAAPVKFSRLGLAGSYSRYQTRATSGVLGEKVTGVADRLSASVRADVRDKVARMAILRATSGGAPGLEEKDVRKDVCDALSGDAKIPPRAAIALARDKLLGVFGLELVNGWKTLKEGEWRLRCANAYGGVRHILCGMGAANTDGPASAGRFVHEPSTTWTLRVHDDGDDLEGHLTEIARTAGAPTCARRGLLMAILSLLMIQPEDKTMREDELFAALSAMDPVTFDISGTKGDDDENGGCAQLRDWRKIIMEDFTTARYLERRDPKQSDADADAAAALTPAATGRGAFLPGGNPKYYYRMGPRARMVIGPVSALAVAAIATNSSIGGKDDLPVLLGNEGADIVPILEEYDGDEPVPKPAKATKAPGDSPPATKGAGKKGK